MKYKNIDIVNMINFLAKVRDKKLPQKISFAIMKNSAILSNEYNVYEKSLRKIFKDYEKYCIKESDGNIAFDKNGIPVVHEAKRDEFISELNDLLAIETDISLYHIEEYVFNYDDPRGIYDVLTPEENFVLVNILCGNSEEEAND